MTWLRNNKLTVFLVLIIVFLLAKSLFNVSPVYRSSSGDSTKLMSEIGIAPSAGNSGVANYSLPQPEAAPVDQADRMVVEESSLSLLVKNVRESADLVVSQAKEAGGFMVSSSLSSPEESAFATVVVRVPNEKFRDVVGSFRGLAVKVTSESLFGTDVTSEYVDLQARLDTLQKTKTKFEQILDQAVNIQDILEVQRELTSLQGQIDSLKGQQNYLEKTAQLSKITVYLSSDELALPYAPATLFRPAVVLKLAVRSLVTTLRGVATALIWVVVYAAIWLPVLLVALWLRRRWLKKRGDSGKVVSK